MRQLVINLVKLNVVQYRRLERFIRWHLPLQSIHFDEDEDTFVPVEELMKK